MANTTKKTTDNKNTKANVKETKTMKKALSLILAIAMLLTMTVGFGSSAEVKNLLQIDEFEDEKYRFKLQYSTAKKNLNKSSILKKLRSQMR